MVSRPVCLVEKIPRADANIQVEIADIAIIHGLERARRATPHKAVRKTEHYEVIHLECQWCVDGLAGFDTVFGLRHASAILMLIDTSPVNERTER